MATAVEGIRNLQSLFECAICLEKYTDPRLLQCGHQFCSACLEGILEKQVTRCIPCPSCRHVTDLQPGKTVSDLPRAYFLNEIQEKIADIVKVSNKREGARLCDLCVGDKVTASYYCAECDENFCVTCKRRHEDVGDIEGHAALPFDNFCSWHSKKKVVKYCRECNCFVCAQCIMGDHNKHKTAKISDAILEGRGRLAKFIIECDTLHEDTKKTQQIRVALAVAEKGKSNFHAAISNNRRLLKDLEAKLDIIDYMTEQSAAAEIQTLSRILSEAESLISFKRSLLERARYLLETASEQELVLQGKFPTSAEIAIIGHMPKNDTMWGSGAIQERLRDNLQSNIEVLDLALTDLSHYGAAPVADLVLHSSIDPGRYGHVIGLAADVSRQRLVVRTLHPAAPIKVYDHAGVLREQLGAGVQGIEDYYVDYLIADEGYVDKMYEGVGFDSKRNFYLVPCQSTVNMLDTKGTIQNRIQVGSDLRGVAYCVEDDSYVLSDKIDDQIIVVHAETKQVITQFKSPGSGCTHIGETDYFCVGKVAGVSRPAIVVSDRNNGCVKVVDMSGAHIKTFGSKGRGDGQLQSPRGVAIDPAGRIIVADWGNHRVVSYWTDNEQEQWRCLLGDEQPSLIQEPDNVAFDPISRILSVVCDEHIYQYKG